MDGTRTWVRPDAAPGTAAFPLCSQSQGGGVQAPVAFGGGGRVYMALGGWGAEEAARTGGAILVARTSGLGNSWDTTVAYSARGKSGEAAENVRPAQSIAVGRRKGADDVVHVTFALTKPGLTAPNAATASAMWLAATTRPRLSDGKAWTSSGVALALARLGGGQEPRAGAARGEDG